MLEQPREYTWKSILHRLFDVPGVVLIEGIGKVGKTDFALKISQDLTSLPSRHATAQDREMLIKDVASNIETKGFYPQIYDLISIKDWLYSSTHRKLYIFDEANEYLSNLRVMSSSNVGFTRLLPQVTKAHARMIVVGHDFAAIDKNILRNAWCKGMFRKTSLKTALLLSTSFNQTFQFNEISRTTVPFDPYAVAPFQEKPTGVIRFKEGEKEQAWQWVNGSSPKDLGLHPMQINRLVRKLLRQYMEMDSHLSQS